MNANGLLKIIFLLPITFALAEFAFAKEDVYKNFSELSAHHKEGQDFVVNIQDRHAPVCVLAIHGGKIEKGTDKLAQDIAGSDWSLYTFSAQMRAHNQILHLTSTHFDDPRAVLMAKSAKVCVSLHGFKDEGESKACIGGGNVKLRDHLKQVLTDAQLGIVIESPCSQFGGATLSNIVNRSQDQGVQIEMSGPLRERFAADSSLKDKFVLLVRKALSSPQP